MSESDFFRRVDEVFRAAVALPPERRATFLAEACGADAALRGEVEALLSHDAAPAGIFKTQAAIADQAMRAALHADAMAHATPMPRRIGAYRPIRVLGEGGFGIVYLAEQEFPKRIVAVKVLRPAMVTPDTLRRFEWEAQVLARLQHPGIAQVFEAGSASTGDDGSHRVAFVAMEYVDGRSLQQFAHDKAASMRDRLELIAQVCDAAQHAHQRGIIHRDLKPANIMVAASGQPKILDFGVARAIDVEAGATMVTSAGQLIGTLSYMSPEQVSGDRSEVDTRSDVYSIGVILYELLTGKLPYVLNNRALHEAARVIREEPPRSMSAISRRLRGEVEVIVGCALAKSKSRRYQSAAEFAADIRRFLSGEAIAARRDSALYVMRKQLRRYWAACTITSIFIVLLIGFAVFQSKQARWFHDLAQRESASKRDALDSLATAIRERRRAEAAQAQLETELSISRVERARTMRLNSDFYNAESTIWRELLVRPGFAPAYWALCELYSNFSVVRTLEFTMDGMSGSWVLANDRLLAGGRDGQTRILELETGRELACFDGDGPNARVSVTPDERFMAVGCDSGTTTVWNLVTHERLASARLSRDDLLTVALHPDGEWVVIASRISELILWNAKTGERYAINPGKGWVNSIEFSPDGRWMAASNSEKHTYVWSCDDLTGPPVLDCFGNTRLMRFDQTGRKLLIAAEDGTFQVLDPDSGTVLLDEKSPAPVYQCAFDPSRPDCLATTSTHGVELWNIRDPAEHRTITASGAVPSTMYFIHGGEQLLGVHSYGASRIFMTHGLARRFTHGKSAYESATFAFMPDGSKLVAGYAGGQIAIWDMATGIKEAEWHGHDSRIRGVIPFADGRRFATGEVAGVIRVWSLDDHSMLRELRGIESDMITLSSDGANTLVGTDRTYGVRIWNADTGALVQSIPLGKAPLGDARFSRDGKLIAAGDFQANVRVFDVASMQVLAYWHYGQATSRAVAFGPLDGQFAAAVGRHIYLYGDNGVTQRYILKGHLASILAIAFSPDGRFLASGDGDGDVRIWDTATGLGLAELPGHVEECTCVHFSEDGRYLATSGRDQVIQVWDLSSFSEFVRGNVDYQRTRYREELGDSVVDSPELLNWIASLSR